MEKNEILKRISAINHALDSIANDEFQKIGLTKGKYQYLNRIAEHPELTQTELSELLRVDKATVSRAVNKLIQEKLVAVKYDSDNSKNRHLILTEKGKSYSEIIERENDCSTKQALAGLDNDEIKQLDFLLQKVEKNTGLVWTKVRTGVKRNY